MPAFHLHSPNLIAEKCRECVEKNGYLDQKEKEGEETKGATHGNYIEEFDFENGKTNSWKK